MAPLSPMASASSKHLANEPEPMALPKYQGRNNLAGSASCREKMEIVFHHLIRLIDSVANAPSEAAPARRAEEIDSQFLLPTTLQLHRA